jgi:hypothetical protein
LFAIDPVSEPSGEYPAMGPLGSKSRYHPVAAVLLVLGVALGWSPSSSAESARLRYFPAGSIYEFRWKVLQLALDHTLDHDGPIQLAPYPEDVTQNRGASLLESGDIDVIALGTSPEREERLLPVRIDIMRGIVGFRLLVIRAQDQERIAAMNGQALSQQLTFGLNSQWADLPIMRANGFTVITSTNYDSLFAMLAAGRFDAFPRGLNEAFREIGEQKSAFPQLAVERTKALFFPFPIYFWVRQENTALARRIERGLTASLADNSYRAAFESYHASEIAALKRDKRQIIRLANPNLPAGSPATDTRWWWTESAADQ